uniref:CNH domain-containing protein n=1 Tax=Rhabditophanes sp. KR3021 TaxID=114890 RepID=A0AC35U8G2_9BILA
MEEVQWIEEKSIQEPVNNNNNIKEESASNHHVTFDDSVKDDDDTNTITDTLQLEDREADHLDHCQAKLKKNIKEALNLLDQLNFEPKDRSYLNEISFEENKKIEPKQTPSPNVISSNSISSFSLTASSYIISEIEMDTPNGMLIIPNSPYIVVTDSAKGLIVFNMETKTQQIIREENWKDVQAPAYDWRKEEVNVVITLKEDLSFQVCKINVGSMNIASKINFPKILKDNKLSRVRLAVADNGFVYMSLNCKGCGTLYELDASQKWTELVVKRGHFYSDIIVLKVINSVTEVLLLEETKGYLIMECVWQSTSSARGIVVPVEKPMALTSTSGSKRIFVVDNATHSALELNKANFERLKNVALVDTGKNLISATERYLAILNTTTKTVKLHLV